MPEHVVCGAHGETPATFVCRHLAGGVACGYHAAADDEGPWPDAWCDLCNEALATAGGEWTEANEALADIKVMCTHCYEAARTRNQNVPELLRGARALLSAGERSRLYDTTRTRLSTLQQGLSFCDGTGGWAYDDGQRTLSFSGADRPTVIADVRMVGSFSTETGTFQWSWGAYGDHAPEVHGVPDLRELGVVRGLPDLTTKLRTCELCDAWDMTSLASYVLGGIGAYRAPFDHAYWFMLIDRVRTVGQA